MMGIIRLTMLLWLWTVWPTMAQELPKKSSNHVGNSNNDPVAHQEAKVTSLRKKKRSIDAKSIEETASGQELDSTTWSRFLFPLFRTKRNRTPTTRKKTQRSRKRRGFIVNRNRVSSGRRKRTITNRGRTRTNGGRTKGGTTGYIGNISSTRNKRPNTTGRKKRPPTNLKAPVASPAFFPVESPTVSEKKWAPTLSPAASPAVSPVTPPTLPEPKPTPAFSTPTKTPTPAPIIPAPTPTLAPVIPTSQPVATEADAPSAPNSPVAR